MKKQAAILIAIFLVVIGFGTWLALKSNKPANKATADSNLLVRSDSYQTNPGAKVTIVEFGDFQCPACGVAYSSITQILDQNKNINFVFRNFPLPAHQNAPIASEAAEAAGAQGKFFEMYAKLYQTQNDWSSQSNPLDTFVSYAQGIGLDTNKFKQDIQNNAYASKIAADQKDGNALRINATPTFYINGKQFVGIPGQDFTAEIQNDLK